ncbi:spinster family MFS transporter [Altererythrobacter sp. Z27]|uniref:spinster family MFS transporter n=1 Tax=Altererythrobacter sp. Z27 TaxID=3461147 RepID=UPI004044DE1D
MVESEDHLSRGQQRYIIGLLCVVYTLNFLDRQIINILAEPIKQDLRLPDWQLGVLTGLGFVLFYSVLSVVIARISEYGNRPKIIAVCLAVWSGFTALSGLAQSFVHLLLARIGVGIGEAGCAPPAHSLICDIVPEDRRARALATFSMGAPIGSLLGLAIGGLLASAMGWRAAFFVVGLPGIAIALLLVLTLRDPRAKNPVVRTDRSSDFSAAVRELKANRTFRYTVIGSGFVSMVSIGHAAFFGSFYLRNHADGLETLASGTGLEPLALLGVALGLTYGLSATVGTYLSGVIADRAARADRRGYLAVTAGGPLIGAPIYVAAMLVDGFMPSILLLGLSAIFNSFYLAPTVAVVQAVVDRSIRATASAVMLLVVSLISFGIGPVAIGILSDWLATSWALGEGGGIRWAQVWSTGVLIVGFALYFCAARTMPGDLK